MRKFIHIIILIFGSIIILLSPEKSISFPDIPDDNLAYPVLIEGNNNNGSGFWYNKKDYIYLITARHVLFEDTTSMAMPQQYTIPESLRYKTYWGKTNNIPMLFFSGEMSEEERNELIKAAPKAMNFNFKDAFETMHNRSSNMKLRNDTLLLTSYAPKSGGDPGENIFTVELTKLFEKGFVKYHPNYDVAYVKISIPHHVQGKDMFKPVDGVKIIKAKGTLGLAENNFKLFKDVTVGNEVFLFGYPTSISMTNPWMNVQVPLLRKGIVAGKNDKLRVIILDCPAYFGNSGGLVIESEKEFSSTKLKAIGIISNYVPFQGDWKQNSGYSIVVPMDFIEELITGTKM